jgi:hypothetical protein
VYLNNEEQRDEFLLKSRKKVISSGVMKQKKQERDEIKEGDKKTKFFVSHTTRQTTKINRQKKSKKEKSLFCFAPQTHN